MICQLQIIFFFCPFGILQYKFLSYREVLHVLSELSEFSKLSELIELPEVFSSMKKCLFHGALRPGDPPIKLLKLRFVSLSSETSRSLGTTQTSQSPDGSHPAFPDACHMWHLLVRLSETQSSLVVGWELPHIPIHSLRAGVSFFQFAFAFGGMWFLCPWDWITDTNHWCIMHHYCLVPVVSTLWHINAGSC